MWDKQAVLSFVKHNKTSIWGTHDDQGKREEKGKEKKIGGKRACESDASEGRKKGWKGRWKEGWKVGTTGPVAMWDGMCEMCGMCAAWNLYVDGTRRNISQVSNVF